MDKQEEFVNISVRIRPTFSASATSCLQVINQEPPILLVSDKTYHFNNIFTDEANQKDIYNSTVKLLVENVKAGYNSTVFAYGQTGTGKTYTMGTNPEVLDEDEFGLIPQALEDFFSNRDDQEVDVYISFIEIYNEKVFDLLSDNNTVPLVVKGFAVQGVQKVKVTDRFGALLCLNRGGKNRHTGDTKQNSSSSRSHAIFTIYCTTRNSESETHAKLNLVDLAGSESVKKTGNRGDSFHEGININKGLLSLGQVMKALSTNSSYVPYRQSIITTILQDSLNKKNFVSLIACVSPSSDDSGETIQTLEFSQRVRKMRNKPVVNQIILQYKKDHPFMFNTPASNFTPARNSRVNPYETPFKSSRHNLPTVQESRSCIESPESLFSASTISVSSDLQQYLSPIVKKYTNALEQSIMAKLEDLKNIVTHDKENCVTPSFSWDKVSKMVRSEIVQFSVRASRATATSSPLEGIETIQTLRPRKLLEEDTINSPSMLLEQTMTNNELDDAIFKIPAPRTEIGSTRLKTNQLDNELSAKNDTNRRRSVRLLQKREATAVTIEDSQQPRKIRKVQDTLRKNKRVSTVKKSNNSTRDSPITTRTKQVLRVLNLGSLSELEKLHTVGSKTAEKIHFLRELKGPFNSVNDISDIWSKKKYEMFLAANFLRG